MFLHGVDDARIWQGDTLSNPQNVEDDNLMKFQVVVASPPFSLDKWDSGFLSEAEADSKGKKKMSAELDQYHRFDWGVPPTSKGDSSFRAAHALQLGCGKRPHGSGAAPWCSVPWSQRGKNSPSAGGNESAGCSHWPPC